MKEKELRIHDVCAIVITYNPDMDEFKENLNSVFNQVGAICIVDNSTSVSHQREIARIELPCNFKVITINDNVGIAKAQNLGIDWAIENGYKATLLLDQDSKLLRDTVEKLLGGYIQLKENGKKVACVGPLAFDRDQNEDNIYHGYDSSDNIIEVRETLSSGSFIPVEAILNVGDMESALFIDLVDYEWCWRARKKGYITYIMSEVKLAHRLGEGKTFGVKKGSPIRHYYQFRNTILLFSRGYVPTSFKLKYLILLPIKFFFFPIFADKKLLRFKMILKGIYDGFRGVTGKGFGIARQTKASEE
ncbi:glycosyltransferase family 2 protein [Robertmurraya sp. Marseille-Q9965]